MAAETGTTEVDFLQGEGDYKGAGLSDSCVKAGKPAINIKTFDKDSDALLAMMSDGTYTQILKKWGVEDGAITPDQVNSGKL